MVPVCFMSCSIEPNDQTPFAEGGEPDRQLDKQAGLDWAGSGWLRMTL